MADNWRETQALVDALSASDNSLVDSLIRRIHPDSRFANAARSAAEVSKAIEDAPSLAVDWLIGPPDGDSAYDPIAEILRPREPKERPNIARGDSSSPTVEEVLAMADRLQETPAFVIKGDRAKGFRFASDDVNSDDYPNTKKPGFSRSERSIADLAQEREAARRRLIELPMIEQAAVMEMAGKDQTSTLKERRDVILEYAARREEEAAMNALAEQAQAALMQRSGGDADFSTQQLNRLSAIVDREIAEGKLPPANRRARVKELLLTLLQDPRMTNAK